MTRKDYVAMAKGFAVAKPIADKKAPELAVWRSLVETFASIAATDNPAFDRARFMAAAGAD